MPPMVNDKSLQQVDDSDALEIYDDPESHRRGWMAQRVAWSAALLVLLAAGLGLFGGGVLSRTTSQMKFAVLEASGKITIVPQSN